MVTFRPVLFFLYATATTEIYTLSLHDALPISCSLSSGSEVDRLRLRRSVKRVFGSCSCSRDRKSTRLNSSHQIISYAVFCLKKKKDVATQMVCSSTILLITPHADVVPHTGPAS